MDSISSGTQQRRKHPANYLGKLCFLQHKLFIDTRINLIQFDHGMNKKDYHIMIIFFSIFLNFTISWEVSFLNMSKRCKSSTQNIHWIPSIVFVEPNRPSLHRTGVVSWNCIQFLRYASSEAKVHGVCSAWTCRSSPLYQPCQTPLSWTFTQNCSQHGDLALNS